MTKRALRGLREDYCKPEAIDDWPVSWSSTDVVCRSRVAAPARTSMMSGWVTSWRDEISPERPSGRVLRFALVVPTEAPVAAASPADDLAGTPEAGHDSLADRFEKLRSIWREETMMSSSLRDIGSHWAYQRIIGLGPDAVPLILRAVRDGDRHWGWALAALTGENPAAETDSPKAAAAAWLSWGVERNFLDDESG